MPRAGWVLIVVVVAGCQSVTAEKPADGDRRLLDRFGPVPDRVELTPARSTVLPGKDVLLIATVFDADGDTRRNRRVEWSVSGPGEIVAVADSGWLPGRSGKRSDKAAVSYTELYDRSTKRGDGATTAVKAGQAWCRVRGGTDETVVTATVPDILDSARRSATAVLEASGRREPADPASPRDTPVAGDRDGRLTPAARQDRDRQTADDRPPRDREATPTGRGSRPAVLTLDASAPTTVGIGQTATVTLTASNRGGSTAPGVNLLARLPDGLELVSSDPPPAVRQGPDEKDLRWGLGGLAAGGVGDRVTLTVRAGRRGEHRIRAAVESADGQRDDRDVAVVADEASLGVSLEVPPTAAEGDRVPVTVVVTNTGGVPVRNATAFVTAGPELMTDLVPKELSVGTLAPGETRRATAKLVAVRPGRPSVWATVTADGGLVQPARGEVIVTANAELGMRNAESKAATPTRFQDRPERPGLDVPRPETRAPQSPPGRPAVVMEVADPPGRVAAGDTVRVKVRVRNRGTASARNVEVSAAGEGALTAVGGVSADRRTVSADAGRVQFPTMPELRPGTVAVFEVELKGIDTGSGRVSAAVRAEHLSRPLKEEHEARVVER